MQLGYGPSNGRGGLKEREVKLLHPEDVFNSNWERKEVDLGFKEQLGKNKDVLSQGGVHISYWIITSFKGTKNIPSNQVFKF